MNTWMTLVLPPLLLMPAMGLISRIETRHGLGAEAKRKLLHVGAGLASLGLPAVFDDPVRVFAGLMLVTTWMLAVRRSAGLRHRFGGVLHDLERRSWGEMLFALSLAWLLITAHDTPLHYILPVLVLSLADAAAALVGRAVPLHPLGGPAKGKTLSGCAAFFGVAWLVGAATLTTIAALPPAQAAAMAALVAFNATVAEAVSHRGLDNLTVPLTTWGTLVVMGV